MKVDEELVEARIREINDAIQMLRGIVSRRYGELSIYERLSMRYLVVQLVEAASSICVHLLISVYGERPQGYPDCFARLGVKGVLPRGLAERLASAARLRNLLVHRYWVIDDERVYESVRRGLKDFEEFVSRIRESLKRGVGSE
ncbi:MAG: DUF86 domain-containing protein [Thermoprotei archaeon]|nr:DUF86 domain-containing protein [Thermoproteales archaeon]RLE94675.1 MAG: DUF86 domain-containing protein [Thermoprotei archaeon]